MDYIDKKTDDGGKSLYKYKDKKDTLTIRSIIKDPCIIQEAICDYLEKKKMKTLIDNNKVKELHDLDNYGFNSQGINVITGKDTCPRGFLKDGSHKYTKKNCDFYGLNRAGSFVFHNQYLIY